MNFFSASYDEYNKIGVRREKKIQTFDLSNARA